MRPLLSEFNESSSPLCIVKQILFSCLWKVLRMPLTSLTASAKRHALAVILIVIALVAGLVVSTPQAAQAAACGSGSAPSGTGSSGDPYLIATAANLEWVSATSASWSNKYFLQTADIDLGGCDFTPIAQGSFFTGQYDGGGFAIRGLVFSSTQDYVGLFYGSDGPFTLKNLALIDVSVTQSYSSTGGSTGAALGIANIWNGSVTISGVLVSGSVRSTTTGNFAGGVLGEAYERGRSNAISLSNIYSAASVRTKNVGAANLIGNLNPANTSETTVTNSVGIGVITVDDNASRRFGLIGNRASTLSAPSVSEVFWNTTTSGASTGWPVTPDVGSGKTTAELQSAATFAAWDIVEGWEAFDFSSPTNFWGICSGVNEGYPFLLWQYTSDPCPARDSGSSSASQGVPGIFLYVAGPVGRTVGSSPVYYGADRVAAASEYTVKVLSTSTRNPSVVSLASGELPINGSLPSTMVRLPDLEPGTYLVRMSGKHSTGKTLELTAQISVGPNGTFTAIGPNIPIIR